MARASLALVITGSADGAIGDAEGGDQLAVMARMTDADGPWLAAPSAQTSRDRRRHQWQNRGMGRVHGRRVSTAEAFDDGGEIESERAVKE